MFDLPTKMTRWLSDFLVGRVMQVNVNGFLTSTTYHNLTTGKTRNPILLMTQGPTKTGKVVCQMENKTES